MSGSAWPETLSGLCAGLLLAASTVVMASVLFVDVMWFHSAQIRDYFFVVLVAAIASFLCFVVPHLVQRLALKTWVIAGVSILAIIAIPLAIWHALHIISLLTFDVERSAWSSVWGLVLNKQAQTLAGVALVVQMLAFALALVQRSRKS